MADDIIKTLIAEAYAEGPEGMRRVAETILNRAAIRGITPEEVVREAHQYTGLKKPGPAARRAWSDPKAITAAQAALELAMQPGDPTNGADHYFAPGSVAKPYWANSMTPKGDYRGHEFYASRPVPPAELNAAVGTLIDTLPPAPPMPVTPSPDMRMMRGVMGNAAPKVSLPPMGTPDVSSLYAGIYAEPKLTQPGAVTASVDRAASAQDPALVAALARRSTVAPPMPKAEVYAQGGPTRPPIDQIGIANTGRPMLSNDDGSFSTELAITVTDPRINGGRATNIPTIWGGHRLNDDMAVNSALASGQKFQSFPSIPAAVAAAEYHSANDITAKRNAPPMPTRVAQSYAGQERAATAKVPTPARLPALPATAVGKAPTTRTVQSVAMPAKPTVSASDKARGSAAQTRNVATTVAVIPTAPTAAQTEAKRMAALYAGGGPTRAPTAPPLPTGAQIAAATPFRQSIPDRLPQQKAGLPELYGASRVAGVGTRAVAPLPQTRVASAQQPVRATVAKAAPVPVSARPMAVGTSLDVQPPMPVVRVPAPVQAPVVKQQPTVLEQMGANFMDRTPIGKIMTAAGPLASNLAAGRPAFAQAPMPTVIARPGVRAAPVPVMPYAPVNRAQHPLLGILDAMAGQRQPGDLLTRLIGPSAPRPPVGANLGKAANGGQMIQGSNGVKNSITQNSDAWKKATGQSSYGSGQSNDTSYGYQF